MGGRGALSALANVDPGLEDLRLLSVVQATELQVRLVTAREIEAQQAIVSDCVAVPDEKDASELSAVDYVALHPNILGLHIGIGVVEYDAVVAGRIVMRRTFVDARVSGKLAVVEAVQVYALAVDLIEAIVRVLGLVYVSGSVDSHRNSTAFGVHNPLWIADTRPGIRLHHDFRCVAHLNSVAPDGSESIANNPPTCIPLRGVKRVRPNSVSEYILQHAILNDEVGSSLLQQNATRRVVSTACVKRAAVVDLQPFQSHFGGPTDQDREVRHVHQPHVPHQHIMGTYTDDSVARIEAHECAVGWSDGQPVRESCSISINRQPLHYPAGANHDYRPPLEVRRCSKRASGTCASERITVSNYVLLGHDCHAWLQRDDTCFCYRGSKR
jgi:hypothetical protein